MFGIVTVYIPYYLFKYAHKTLFLTYFANVDIVANILSINFPDYFKNVYDIDPKTLSEYLTYNVISLIALSGIFIHGINYKNKGKHSDMTILSILILMSIITWTLPTQLIPYIENKIKDFYNIKDTTKDILITTLVSLGFIILEGIAIHLLIFENNLLHTKSLFKGVKFDF